MIHHPDPPDLVDPLGNPLREPEFQGTFSNGPDQEVTLADMDAAAVLINQVREANRNDWIAFLRRLVGKPFREKSRAWFGRPHG